MPINNPPRFDSGPLSWVRAEIELSLTNAKNHLDQLSVVSIDAKAVQNAALCLHQVTGALSMVNLGAAARLSAEIEKLIAALAVANADSGSRRAGDAPQRVAVAKNAMVALSTYLDGLMAGEADRPMMLAPSYLALNRVRGANDAAAIDLFMPDLSVTLSLPEDTAAPLSHDDLAEAVRQARSLFQAGLLKLLRDKDLVEGARTMRDAVLAIESLLFNPTSRSFWFTAAGFFDAVANDPAGAGAPAVQLFGKIDQQIKLLIAGNNNIAEKLFCDLLLVIGKSAARTELINDIREVYRLDDLLAAPAADLNLKADPALVAAVVALSEQVHRQKDNLLAFTSRNSAALEPFAKQAELLAAMAQQMPNRELAQLLHVLGAIGKHLRKTGQLLSEVQALEVAGAMLFIESSLENYFRLNADFAEQAATISTRLRGAMNGVELPALEPTAYSLGDTMTLRAQTHLLIFQVGREVQINLNTIEIALDAFFRDAQKQAELAPLGQLFKQVRGALSMLELDEAALLSVEVGKRVGQFAIGALPGSGDPAAAVAEGISALGAYVDGLQQNAADPRALLLPALIRFGLAEKPVKAKRSAAKARPAAAAIQPAPVATMQPSPAATVIFSAKAAPANEHAVAPAAAPATVAAAATAIVVAKGNPAPLQPVMNEPNVATLPAATSAPTSKAHSALHAAIDKALDRALDNAFNKLPAAAGKPPLPTAVDAQLAASAAPAIAAPAVSAADELNRLKKLEIELRTTIQERDKRIQALELVLANLNASAREAAKH